MTTFLLVRHATNDLVGHTLAGRQAGVYLNEQGRAEAARLADHLARASVDRILSSPLERARETAAPLAEQIGLAVEVSEAIGEIDFGDWTGRSVEELEGEDHWQQFNAFRSGTRAPNGELMLEVQARYVAEMQRLAERHPDETVALFSHKDPIRAVLTYYLGMPLDLFLRIEIDPASVTALTVGDYGPQLLYLNRTFS